MEIIYAFLGISVIVLILIMVSQKNLTGIYRTDREGDCLLKGQLMRDASSVRIAIPKGACKITIMVSKGCLRLNLQNQLTLFELSGPGTYTFEMIEDEKLIEKSELVLENEKFLENALIHYRIEML